NGYNNFYGFPRRFAYLVVTNHSNSDVRLWGLACWEGPRPTSRFRTRALGESFVLTRGSFYRFPIEAPTNGTAWCGMVTLSPDRTSFSRADKILKGLHNSRFGLVKWFADLAAPKIRTED